MRSRPFARSGRRTVDGAIRCRQLQPITIRRTTRPTPLQRRGCELPLVLLGPRRAFTVPCRSLTLSLSARRHARVGLLTARCATRIDLVVAHSIVTKLHLRARGSPNHPAGKSLMASNPRAPSVVFKSLQAETRRPNPRGPDRSREFAHRFAFCPPLLLVIGACGFFLASALLPHEALRPPGAEDARCVQPTSATQTTCVHPHLVRSRLPLTTFIVWTPRRV